MLLIFIFCFTIISILCYLWNRKTSRLHKLTKDIPRPTTLPLVGCTFEFGTNPEEFLHNLIRIIDDNGPVVAVWLGPELFVAISDVDETELILSSNKLLEKSFVYEFLEPWLGTSLLTADGGALWKMKRKIITPAFHFQILEQFMDVFNRNVKILIKQLNPEVGKPTFDIGMYITLCTLDIISESSMGTEINAQLNNSSVFVSALRTLSECVLNRAFKPWLYPNFIYKLTSSNRCFKKDLKIVQDFITKVIQSKKQKRLEDKSKGINGSSNGTSASKGISDTNGVNGTPNTANGAISLAYGQKKKSAFLDLLLDYTEEEAIFTEAALRDEVNTFMFAGHDTTTSAINFALHAIMKNPSVQEKAMAEIDEIFEGSDRMPEFADLARMKYIDCIIKETLRLWPSVPYIGRTVTEDIKLKSGYTLPAGSSAVLVFFKLHRNPELYPDPEAFKPERFFEDTINGRKPFSYCPFSAGPRNCIGQKFAVMEIKVVLSTILRHYRLLPPTEGPDINLVAELVLRSTTGVHVKLEKR